MLKKCRWLVYGATLILAGLLALDMTSVGAAGGTRIVQGQGERKCPYDGSLAQTQAQYICLFEDITYNSGHPKSHVLITDQGARDGLVIDLRDVKYPDNNRMSLDKKTSSLVNNSDSVIYMYERTNKDRPLFWVGPHRAVSWLGQYNDRVSRFMVSTAPPPPGPGEINTPSPAIAGGGCSDWGPGFGTGTRNLKACISFLGGSVHGSGFVRNSGAPVKIEICKNLQNQCYGERQGDEVDVRGLPHGDYVATFYFERGEGVVNSPVLTIR